MKVIKLLTIFLLFISHLSFGSQHQEEFQDDRTKPLKYKIALSIAGSDPSGGAGIQADLKTFSALGCYGMTVLTALTAQNTRGVSAVYSLPRDFVKSQLDSIFEDIEVDVIKIGMLGGPEIVEEVRDILSKNVASKTKVVLDPVMVAKSGDKLIDNITAQAIKEKLLPIALVITPNIYEASILLNGRVLNSKLDIQKAAFELLDMGPQAVVIKGGSLSEMDQSFDCLVLKGHPEPYWFEHVRIQTPNIHGTGCTFSAAIASYLAYDNDILNAIKNAKNYISSAIEKGSLYKIGKGHGPVHHFYDIW